MYPKAAETERYFTFNIFIGNGTAECCIHSIKWRKSANGNRIENPEYLEQGDTAEVILEMLKPIHVAPYHEYPEFGAFIMVYNHSNKIAESFVIGKVNKIIETTALKSVYPKMTDNLSFCWRNHNIFKQTLKFLNSKSDSNPCGCRKRINEMRSDPYLITVSKMKPSYSLRDHWNERNLCMAHYGVALTCGLSSMKEQQLMFSLCNQMSRMLKRLIPMEVVQIIQVYSSKIRKTLCHGSPWKPIEQLAGRDICKIVNCFRKSVPYGHRLSYQYHRMYLEENGTVWTAEFRGRGVLPHPPIQMRYFSENNIVIRDIAIGGMYHCLAVDDNQRIYSWGNPSGNMFGQCGQGHCNHIGITPTLITFPFPDDEVMEQCIAIKCGQRHSYVCFRVKEQDGMDREYVVDKHFMFGYNKENQCLTFDGRNKVLTPFCINETVRAHYGGEIDDVFVESSDKNGRWSINTYVVIKNYYKLT